MKDSQVLEQSKAAYNQWCVQWRAHAKAHASDKHKSLVDFQNTGIGRAVVCVANGFSFEENIEALRAVHPNVDIICCDKTLGHLLDHGIRPKFCLVADANVNYEKYLKPWEDKLGSTILLMNVCANPKWSQNGNWKDQYFYACKDILGSEREFMALSGCPNAIAAGTNVSNALVIMMTQCDHSGRRNWFGYDKILLVGFDYSWRFNGKYYAFDEAGGGKEGYMCHQYIRLPSGEFGYTSGNLYFSAQWLNQYVRQYNLPVVNCTPHSLLGLKVGELSEHGEYRFKPEDSATARKIADRLRALQAEQTELIKKMSGIAKEHWNGFLATV